MIKIYIFSLLLFMAIDAQAVIGKFKVIESELLMYGYIRKVGDATIVPDRTRVGGMMNVGESHSLEIIKKKTWTIPNKLKTGFVLVVEFSKIPHHIQQFYLNITFPEMVLPSGDLHSSITRTIDEILHISL